MSIRSFGDGQALREVECDDTGGVLGSAPRMVGIGGPNPHTPVGVTSFDPSPDDAIQSRLPSQVQVGYRTMTLRWTNPAEQRRRHNTRLGECSVNTGLIEIDPSFGMQEAANTLVHELLHACTNVGGLKIDEADEEHFVNATANVLTNVIRESPELFEWLIEAARAD